MCIIIILKFTPLYFCPRFSYFLIPSFIHLLQHLSFYSSIYIPSPKSFIMTFILLYSWCILIPAFIFIFHHLVYYPRVYIPKQISFLSVLHRLFGNYPDYSEIYSFKFFATIFFFFLFRHLYQHLIFYSSIYIPSPYSFLVLYTG